MGRSWSKAMAVTFDTLKFVETLEEAGVERKHASAIASAVRDSHDAADVATKGDLRNEIALVRKDMEAMENRLLIKLGGMMVIAVGILLVVLPMLIAK